MGISTLTSKHISNYTPSRLFPVPPGTEYRDGVWMCKLGEQLNANTA